jgi:exopolysaccharide biosynthesis WecB/TagA/CpsF family protein
MGAVKKIDLEGGIIPPVPRGHDRRGAERSDNTDWRVNPRFYDFLGATFDPLTPTQTLARAKWITPQHGFRYIVTPNVDHIVRLWKDPATYAPLYQGSWLSVCDSKILEAMAKMSGIPLTAVPGSTLTQQVFDNLIAKDEPVTIIGGDDDLIEEIRRLYGLRAIQHHVPPMGLRNKPDAVASCAQFVADHPARFVFICVGSPQQEMVAKACEARGDCIGLGFCVGASLEFLTGRIKRAPKWMQNARLEWLHRLASEPRRLWKRYLIEGPKIFWIWAKWSMGKRPKAK